MKWINGPITNPVTNATKDIVVKSVLGCKPKDFVIGMGLVVAGGLYLCNACFKNGARLADVAEFNTLQELGLFKN